MHSTDVNFRKTIVLLAFSLLASPNAMAQDSGLGSTSVDPAAFVSARTGRPRVGIALGGGGARGAAHVGVLKVLTEEGVPIDLVAGTSVGSVVGALYCAGMPLDELTAKFDDEQLMKAYLPMPLVLRLALSPVMYVPRLFGYHPYDGLYNGKHFRKYADDLTDRSCREIANLPTPFVAVCTNVVTGEPHAITHGDLGLALEASSAVPGLRKPVQIGDDLFCDGGLVCNLPVSEVKKMGADFVIAVDIDEHLNPVPLSQFRVPGAMARQALRIQLATSDASALKSADFVIHPDTDRISLISKRKVDARRAVEEGMKAARAAMPELKQKLAAIGVQLKR